jgi:hypothetical protein
MVIDLKLTNFHETITVEKPNQFITLYLQVLSITAREKSRSHPCFVEVPRLINENENFLSFCEQLQSRGRVEVERNRNETRKIERLKRPR